MIKEIHNFQQLPVPQNQRRCTDVIWIFIGIAFGLAMLIWAAIYFNINHLNIINLPTDSDHKTCGYELSAYPYLYYTKPQSSNIENRVCVITCPQMNHSKIYCSSTNTFNCDNQLPTYDTYDQSNRLGGFCHPNNSAVYNNMISTFNLQDNIKFLKSLDIMIICIGIGVGISIVYLVLTLFLPVFTTKFTVFVCGILAIVLSILFLTNMSSFNVNSAAVIAISVILILIGITTLAIGVIFWNDLQIYAILIQQASIFIKDSPVVLIFIPIFLILTVCLFILVIFQYLAFSSHEKPTVNNSSIYLKGQFVNAGNILNIIELFWGLFFLKDAFNFNITGNAFQWYINQATTNIFLPTKRIFTKHLGTIFLGSLINLFFAVFQFFLDIFLPRIDGPCNPLTRMCYCCCGWFINTIHLARNDCYTYVNLTGNSYIDSGRQAQYLNLKLQKFSGNNRIRKIYWLGTHLFILCLIIMTAYFLSLKINQSISTKALIVILVASYFVVTYFVQIHLDASQGIFLCFILQYELCNYNMSLLKKCPRSISQQLRKIVQTKIQ